MSDAYDDLWDDPKPKRKPSVHGGIERGILLAANGIWAVVGLVLWLPQLARVLLTTAGRVVHAALTRQPLETVRGPVRRVSRFYTQGFLKPKETMAEGVYGSRDPRLGRFLGEALWALVFYGLAVRLLWPEAGSRLFRTARRWVGGAGEALGELWASAAAGLPDSWQGVVALERGPVILLAALFVGAFAGGWWLARR